MAQNNFSLTNMDSSIGLVRSIDQSNNNFIFNNLFLLFDEISLKNKDLKLSINSRMFSFFLDGRNRIRFFLMVGTGFEFP